MRPGDAGEPFVGDEHRVRQILVNLLSNAVKFTATGGAVTVGCGQADAPPPGAALEDGAPWTFVRVTDTGIGIPTDQLERVFEPFYQVQHTHASRSEGTGLGLAISRRFARRMGGDLTVDSAPGNGSAFTLWLPAAAEGGEGTREPRSVDRAARARTASPVPAGGPDGEASAMGIAEAGAVLRSQLEFVIAANSARLRADAGTPRASRLPRTELEDHMLSFLADVAQTLVVIEESGGLGSDLLRDGTTIQRVISELHGAMRQRRTWEDAEIAREYEILGEELASVVRHAAAEGGRDASLPLDVLARMMGRACDTALASARRHAQGGGSGD